MAENLLHHEFTAYADWRNKLIQNIKDYRDWLESEFLDDLHVSDRVASLLEKLNQDKLRVAFVAEFSRGKSELINAIFFPEYGRRLLPSSVGRTTMCPTEIFYDATKPISIQLLPIETCLSNMTTSEYKRYLDKWHSIELDISDKESVSQAFQEISQVKRASTIEAETYGLFSPNNPDDVANLNTDGTVDIPRWRYAMVNFPHPLLEEGLVIFDTPGLNAVGTEPELTLNLLPNAHAVLFVLCADTGVTKSESDVWHRYIAVSRWKRKGRLAVLNKIDGLWDEHNNEAVMAQEINKQVMTTSQLLDLSIGQIYPISAKQGLLAKINQDVPLLHKSRLLILEKALSEQLLPAKREIVSENTQDEIQVLMSNTQMVLDARLQSAETQLHELIGFRGKSIDLFEAMMEALKKDKQAFEDMLHRFQVFRSTYSEQASLLINLFSVDAVREQIHITRAQMEAANFSVGLCHAMDDFFKDVNGRLVNAESKVGHLQKMLADIYLDFDKTHGLSGIQALEFDIDLHKKELALLARIYAEKFNTPINMIVNEKNILIAKFFETLASRVMHVFEKISKQAEAWARGNIAPLETQLRERQIELRKRLSRINKINQEKDSFESKIEELEAIKKSVHAQLNHLNSLRERIMSNLIVNEHTEELAA